MLTKEQQLLCVCAAAFHWFEYKSGLMSDLPVDVERCLEPLRVVNTE